MSGDVPILIFGFLGGIAAELLAIAAALREKGKLPSSRRGIVFMITLGIDGFLAMAVVWAWSQQTPLNPFIALQIGASTPLIIQGLSRAVGQLRPPSENDPNFARIGQKPFLPELIRQHFALTRSE